MEERAESKPKSDQQDSKTDGGFLSGITGGIKSLFGGGGDDKDAPKQSETKEDSSSGDGGFNESSLKAAMDKAGYTDPTERAMFLAQMAHESGNFRYDEEIHDGSNYEGRSDLGNTQPGDGKRYKGRGYIQLTGRANYTHYGSKLGVDLAGKPELAKRPDIAADVAVAYWNERVDRAAAVKGDVRTVTRNINGGYNGLQDRIDKFKKYSGNPNYTAPGGGLIASSSSSGSGELTSDSGGGSGGGSSKPVASYDELVANFRSSGGSPSKSMSKPAGGSPPGPPVSAFQALQTGFGGPGGGSGSSSASGGQQSSGNSSNAMTSSGNTFPDIDANAAISPDKIKVLGLTVA
jgi:predicted chitinase